MMGKKNEGGFSPCGIARRDFVSGHDFSRAGRSQKTKWALAPAELQDEILYQGTTSVVPEEAKKRSGL
ncbi:MAG TPA: hypothetical protein VH308_05075 [Terracidiphilus sp.]|nr:hypothetical protein [Terracidiphilus sp.]